MALKHGLEEVAGYEGAPGTPSLKDGWTVVVWKGPLPAVSRRLDTGGAVLGSQRGTMNRLLRSALLLTCSRGVGGLVL